MIKRWPTIAAAARGLGIHEINVGQVLRGKNRTAGGFKWRYSSSVVEVIEQLDAETGEVLGRWPSRAAAARGVGLYINSVARVLRGEQSTAGGFKWRVTSSQKEEEEEKDGEEEAAAPKRIVEQLDAETGRVIAQFKSSYVAGRELGINNIRRVLRGEQSTAGGFRWRATRVLRG